MAHPPRQFLIRLVLWLLVLLNITLIFFFSSQPGPQSAKTSAGVTEAIARLTVKGFEQLSPAEKNKTIRALQLPVRKAAHALEFCLLGFLLLLAWSRYTIPLSRQLLLSLGIALAVALLDELFQGSVAGRGPSWSDAGIDTLGAIVGIMIASFSRGKSALRAREGRP